MKKSLVVLSSGIALSVGLTLPAFAQLGRGAVGGTLNPVSHADLEPDRSAISSADRAGLGAGTNELGQQVQGASSLNNSTQSELKSKHKKISATQNEEAAASTQADNKKHKGKHHDELSMAQNSDAAVKSNPGAKVTEADTTKLNSDVNRKVESSESSKADANAAAHANVEGSSKPQADLGAGANTQSTANVSKSTSANVTSTTNTTAHAETNVH